MWNVLGSTSYIQFLESNFGCNLTEISSLIIYRLLKPILYYTAKE